MIGKGKSISHGGASMNYAIQKDKAEILGRRNLAGDNSQAIVAEMKPFQNLNGNCKNNTMSFVLSPDKNDKITDEQLKNVASRFLEKMGLLDHQTLVVKHIDNKNQIPHLHIYTNRINLEGQAYNDSFLGKKVSRIADEIAQEQKLTRAKIVQQEKELAQKPVKEQIQKIFNDGLKHSNNPKEFFEYIHKQGIETEKSIDKKGNVRGYRVKFKDLDLKASQVGNKFTIAKISKAISMAQTIINPASIITKAASKIIKPPSQDRGGPSL